ncbi:unnamed protein product [Periconia digitata]|uniref:Cytochrome P450 n=1 Tax=Periconia digitata TaxID=1303443 RepID=A0A9W4UPY1_9PLEO|nr:unnamed protein product [Periconia digitata]
MALADVVSKLYSTEINMMQCITTIIAVISVSIIVALTRWTLGTLRPKNFPPGPRVTPGLGNLLQMPISKSYLTFHKWYKTYGDLVGLKVGTANMVIINSPEVVTELFDKRGASYSGRPYNYILCNHVFPSDGDKALAILPYNSYQRRLRKSLTYILSSSGISRVMPILEAEAANLSRLCLDGGDNYVRNLYYWSISGPLAITCGKRMDDLPGDYTKAFLAAQKALLDLLVPGVAPPVDVFPILKYVPEWMGASWKADARKAHAMHLTDRTMYLNYGKEQRDTLKKDPSSVGFASLLAKIMEDMETKPGAPKFSDVELAHMGANITGAAVDTTVATFKSLMVFLACYPEVMRKVQAEVDRVGNGKPPTSDKLDQLVYLQACISETLRLRPTTPSALPHTIEKDDHFRGYVFPKGTTFLINAWTMNNNEEDYDRPEEWVPERFLENSYGLRPERFAALAKAIGATDTTSGDKTTSQPVSLGSRRVLYTFGSGRRICPGVEFATTSLLLAASKLLWAYDILPPPGGVDVSIETGFEDGVVIQPKNPLIIPKLRDDMRKQGLMEDYERTQAIAHSLIP